MRLDGDGDYVGGGSGNEQAGGALILRHMEIDESLRRKGRSGEEKNKTGAH